MDVHSEEEAEQGRVRQLPSDLPRSLHDRKPTQSYGGETEMYDGWQGTRNMALLSMKELYSLKFYTGQSQFLTTPTPVSPLAFNLSVSEDDDYNHFTPSAEDNDTRLMEMLAAQAAHREDESVPGDEEAVISDEKLSEDEKRRLLQKSLHMAASNGDIDRVKRLVEGKARRYIDLDAADEEGTAPLIYASCFVSLGWTFRSLGLTLNRAIMKLCLRS